MDPIISDMISVGGTIIGALLGVWVGYRLSLSLSDRTVKRNACLKLRQAFKNEILALNPAHHVIDLELPVFLQNAFGKHEAAIFDFSFFLNDKSIAAFYEAWEKYYCHPNARSENIIPFFEQYSCRGLTIREIHDMKNLVRSRIEAILEFTKFK